jgi:predicted Zn-dependent protease
MPGKLIAVSFLQEALRDYPVSPDLWQLLAFAQYQQHNRQEALDASSKAKQLNPDEQNRDYYTRIQNNQPITASFGSKTFTINAN